MKYTRTVSVKCPKCNETGSFRIYDRFSVTDSKLRGKIRDRSIFRYRCECCGTHTEFDYPFHMIDKDRKQILFMSRPDERESTLKLLHDIDEKTGGKMELRITHTKNEFIEKLHIADVGYDDRIIEFMKVYFARKIKKDFPERSIDEVLFITDNHPEGELVFHEKQCPFAAVKVEKEVYDTFVDLFRKKAEENDSYEIGFHWAHTLF